MYYMLMLLKNFDISKTVAPGISMYDIVRD